MKDMKEQATKALSRYRKEADRLLAEGRRRAASAKSSVRSAGKRLSRNEKLAIILAVGIVVGYGAKLAFRDTVTMGYQDYTVRHSAGEPYDLLEMERELDRKQAEAAAAAIAGEAVEEMPIDGGSCE